MRSGRDERDLNLHNSQFTATYQFIAVYSEYLYSVSVQHGNADYMISIIYMTSDSPHCVGFLVLDHGPEFSTMIS